MRWLNAIRWRSAVTADVSSDQSSSYVLPFELIQKTVWIDVSPFEQGLGVASSFTSLHELGLLAIGTDHGRILLYDLKDAVNVQACKKAGYTCLQMVLRPPFNRIDAVLKIGLISRGPRIAHLLVIYKSGCFQLIRISKQATPPIAESSYDVSTTFSNGGGGGGGGTTSGTTTTTTATITTSAGVNTAPSNILGDMAAQLWQTLKNTKTEYGEDLSLDTDLILWQRPNCSLICNCLTVIDGLMSSSYGVTKAVVDYWWDSSDPMILLRDRSGWLYTIKASSAQDLIPKPIGLMNDLITKTSWYKPAGVLGNVLKWVSGHSMIIIRIINGTFSSKRVYDLSEIHNPSSHLCQIRLEPNDIITLKHQGSVMKKSITGMHTQTHKKPTQEDLEQFRQGVYRVIELQKCIYLVSFDLQIFVISTPFVNKAINALGASSGASTTITSLNAVQVHLHLDLSELSGDLLSGGIKIFSLKRYWCCLIQFDESNYYLLDLSPEYFVHESSLNLHPQFKSFRIWLYGLPSQLFNEKLKNFSLDFSHPSDDLAEVLASAQTIENNGLIILHIFNGWSEVLSSTVEKLIGIYHHANSNINIGTGYIGGGSIPSTCLSRFEDLVDAYRITKWILMCSRGKVPLFGKVNNLKKLASSLILNIWNHHLQILCNQLHRSNDPESENKTIFNILTEDQSKFYLDDPQLFQRILDHDEEEADRSPKAYQSPKALIQRLGEEVEVKMMDTKGDPLGDGDTPGILLEDPPSNSQELQDTPHPPQHLTSPDSEAVMTPLSHHYTEILSPRKTPSSPRPHLFSPDEKFPVTLISRLVAYISILIDLICFTDNARILSDEYLGHLLLNRGLLIRSIFAIQIETKILQQAENILLTRAGGDGGRPEGSYEGRLSGRLEGHSGERLSGESGEEILSEIDDDELILRLIKYLPQNLIQTYYDLMNDQLMISENQLDEPPGSGCALFPLNSAIIDRDRNQEICDGSIRSKCICNFRMPQEICVAFCNIMYKGKSICPKCLQRSSLIFTIFSKFKKFNHINYLTSPKSWHLNFIQLLFSDQNYKEYLNLWHHLATKEKTEYQCNHQPPPKTAPPLAVPAEVLGSLESNQPLDLLAEEPPLPPLEIQPPPPPLHTTTSTKTHAHFWLHLNKLIESVELNVMYKNPERRSSSSDSILPISPLILFELLRNWFEQAESEVELMEILNTLTEGRQGDPSSSTCQSLARDLGLARDQFPSQQISSEQNLWCSSDLLNDCILMSPFLMVMNMTEILFRKINDENSLLKNNLIKSIIQNICDSIDSILEIDERCSWVEILILQFIRFSIISNMIAKNLITIEAIGLNLQALFQALLSSKQDVLAHIQGDAGGDAGSGGESRREQEREMVREDETDAGGGGGGAGASARATGEDHSGGTKGEHSPLPRPPPPSEAKRLSSYTSHREADELRNLAFELIERWEGFTLPSHETTLIRILERQASLPPTADHIVDLRFEFIDKALNLGFRKVAVLIAQSLNDFDRAFNLMTENEIIEYLALQRNSPICSCEIIEDQEIIKNGPKDPTTEESSLEAGDSCCLKSKEFYKMQSSYWKWCSNLDYSLDDEEEPPPEATAASGPASALTPTSPPASTSAEPLFDKLRFWNLAIRLILQHDGHSTIERIANLNLQFLDSFLNRRKKNSQVTTIWLLFLWHSLRNSEVDEALKKCSILLRGGTVGAFELSSKLYHMILSSSCDDLSQGCRPGGSHGGSFQASPTPSICLDLWRVCAAHLLRERICELLRMPPPPPSFPNENFSRYGPPPLPISTQSSPVIKGISRGSSAVGFKSHMSSNLCLPSYEAAAVAAAASGGVSLCERNGIHYHLLTPGCLITMIHLANSLLKVSLTAFDPNLLCYGSKHSIHYVIIRLALAHWRGDYMAVAEFLSKCVPHVYSHPDLTHPQQIPYRTCDLWFDKNDDRNFIIAVLESNSDACLPTLVSLHKSYGTTQSWFNQIYELIEDVAGRRIKIPYTHDTGTTALRKASVDYKIAKCQQRIISLCDLDDDATGGGGGGGGMSGGGSGLGGSGGGGQSIYINSSLIMEGACTGCGESLKIGNRSLTAKSLGELKWQDVKRSLSIIEIDSKGNGWHRQCKGSDSQWVIPFN